MPPVTQASAAPYVPQARIDLSDRMLADVADLWENTVANPGALTAAEADLIAFSVGPFLRELLQRRAAMAVIETVMQPGTVVAFQPRGQG